MPVDVSGAWGWVSQRQLCIIQILIRAYEEVHKLHVALETKVDGLKSRMADMEKIVASLSQSGTQMRSSTDHESSSRVRPLSTHQETQASSRSTLPRTYKLTHLRKSTVVAFGSLMWVSPDNSDCYRIVIDEIVDGDIELRRWKILWLQTLLIGQHLGLSLASFFFSKLLGF